MLHGTKQFLCCKNKMDYFKAVFDNSLSDVFVGDLNVVPLFPKKSVVIFSLFDLLSFYSDF